MKSGTSIIAPVLALALVASAPARPAQSEDLKDVSCSAIDLKYDGPATTTRCLQLDQFGNQTEVKVQRLIAKSDSSELILTYLAGKFRTYFPIKPLRQQIDDAGYFNDTDNWRAERKFGGFDIAAFDGFDKAGGAPILCAGFSRYSGRSSGPYEYEGGPGASNHAIGLFCVFSGQAALINPIDNFYRVVDDVIAKLHLPQ